MKIGDHSCWDETAREMCDLALERFAEGLHIPLGLIRIPLELIEDQSHLIRGEN